jgi:TonB family protein
VASASSASPRGHETATQAVASGQPGSQPAADITAITTRDDFLLELGQTLGGQASVRPVDTLEAALEGVTRSKRGQVLVIDARDVANVRAAVDAAHAAAPRAVVLVFAEGTAEKQLGAALKGSRVFAVLPAPIDPRKTQAVLDAAIADAVANKAAAPTAAASPAPAMLADPSAVPATAATDAPLADLSIGTFRPQSATVRAEGSDGRRKPAAALIAAAAAAVALAAGGYWFLTHRESTPAATAPASPAPAAASSAAPASSSQSGENLPAAPVAETSIVQGKVDELLEKARRAMKERRFTEPSGDNALLYYRSAVAADAANAEAIDGLKRIAGVLASRFDDAMNGGRFDEAAATLAGFKAAAPADARIGAFEQRLYAAEISKALADGNLDRAAAYLQRAQQSSGISVDQIGKWRADITRHQEDARLQRLAVLVEDRIRDGKLTDGDESAKSYLQQLQTVAPTNASTQRATHDLIGAYLRKAREAAAARSSADVDHWLYEARAVGMRPAEIAAFQKELAAARQKATQAESDRLAQLARERLHDGRLTDPPQDSAAWYLTQLQAADPNNASLADASHDLAKALLERARAEVQTGRYADADLAQAKRWGADPGSVLAVQQSQAQPRARSAAVDPATLAAKLKPLRAAPPEYPLNAMQQHLTGSVTLAYTVDVRGETRDIQVIEATPTGVFDEAAIDAVKHWRYAPMIVNGAAVEVPVRTRVRFELPK